MANGACPKGGNHKWRIKRQTKPNYRGKVFIFKVCTKCGKDAMEVKNG